MRSLERLEFQEGKVSLSGATDERTEGATAAAVVTQVQAAAGR
jgi:hypothetical protein